MKPIILAALAIFGLVGTAAAQTGDLPPAAVQAIRAFGPVQNAEAIQFARRLMAPLQAALPAAVKIEVDLAYGPGPRHRLDVFRADDGSAAPRPVLVFIHGGGYVGGEKSLPDMPFYQNIGTHFATEGFVAVNATYHLAPAHPWPAGMSDVGLAVAWVQANIARFGGDPARIVLAGHSAGASHVASYLFLDPRSLEGKDGLVGAVLLSGSYDPTAFRGSPATKAYFGEDESQYAARNPIAAVARRRLPVLVGFAQYDPPVFQVQGMRLYQALCERDGKCPRLFQAQDHNHMTEVYAINTADRRLAREIAAFARAPM